jgi:hypothetical protein
MGIIRFGKFGSTYNDNGTAEKSGKIDHLVNALQTYGMAFRDTAELYRTGEGEYALEDTNGAVITTVNNTREWRRQNRRMFAQVRNAKAKPIERFFRTLDVLQTGGAESGQRKNRQHYPYPDHDDFSAGIWSSLTKPASAPSTSWKCSGVSMNAATSASSW